MKKIFIFLMAFVLVMSVAGASGSGGNSAGAASSSAGNVKTSTTDIQDSVQVQQNSETKTQSQGEETQIQNQVQVKVKSGSYTTENGEQIQVQEQTNNEIQIKSGVVSAQTAMEMTQEKTQEGTKLQVMLSNGKNSEVKIMPDAASERALERLQLKVCSEENGCVIELKEVGTGNQMKLAYEVQVHKQAKIFGIFRTKMQVKAQVDAENGEIIKAQKPWWAFLATES